MGKLSTLALIGTTIFAGNKVKNLAKENKELEDKIKDSKILTDAEYEQFLRIGELEQAIADGHVEVREKQVELESAEVKIQLLESSILQLERDLNEKSNDVDDVATLKAELDQKRAELTALNEAKNNLTAALSARGEEVINLQSQLAEKELLIANLIVKKQPALKVDKFLVKTLYLPHSRLATLKSAVTGIVDNYVRQDLIGMIDRLGYYVYDNIEEESFRAALKSTFEAHTTSAIPLDWQYLSNGASYIKADGTLSDTPDTEGWAAKMAEFE